MTTVSLPNLLNGSVNVTRSSLVGTLSLPTLESGYINIEECASVTTISAPVFSNGGLYLRGNDNLKTVAFPSFKKGYLSIYDESITQINLPSLEEVSDFSIRGTKITTLDLSNLKKVTRDVEISNNNQLSNVLLSNSGSVTSSSGETFSFSYNALTSSAVNSILANLVTWTFNETSISLYQSSAPPTGQGLIDKQTLIDAGNTVYTK